MAYKGKLINEIGNIYGPWKVVKRSYYKCRSNHSNAYWICKCMKCGYEYRANGCRLRINKYRHKCPNCGYKGENTN